MKLRRKWCSGWERHGNLKKKAHPGSTARRPIRKFWRLQMRARKGMLANGGKGGAWREGGRVVIEVIEKKAKKRGLRKQEGIGPRREPRRRKTEHMLQTRRAGSRKAG